MRRLYRLLSFCAVLAACPTVLLASGGSFDITLDHTSDSATAASFGLPGEDVTNFTVDATTPTEGTPMDVCVWTRRKIGSTYQWREELCVGPGDTAGGAWDDVVEIVIAGPDWDPNPPNPSNSGDGRGEGTYCT